jgi:thioesterase domain-containing protein
VGPYYIGGYSFGGRVAYVMAQQLRAGGEEVGLLALIDTYSAHGRHLRETGDWLTHHWERIRELPPGKVPGYLWLRARNFQNMIYMKLRLKSYAAAWRYYKSRGKPLPRILWRPVPANDMIRDTYHAQPYDGDATLFKGKLYSWSHQDQHDGWNKLIRGRLEIRPIPAHHYEIMQLPYVRILAAELTDALRKAQAAHEKPLRRSG